MSQLNESSIRPQSPLEQLVFQQLQQLISGQRMLEQQYSQLKTTSESDREATVFAAELSELDSRADRLRRMMDAMTGYSAHN